MATSGVNWLNCGHWSGSSNNGLPIWSAALRPHIERSAPEEVGMQFRDSFRSTAEEFDMPSNAEQHRPSTASIDSSHLRPLRPAAILALVVTFMLAPMSASWAVICDNGGAGPNPAGQDEDLPGEPFSTACGKDSAAIGHYTTVFGYKSRAYDDRNTAIGSGSHSLNIGAHVAVGASADADGDVGANVSLGAFANSSGDTSRNIAVGRDAEAHGWNGDGHWVAVGHKAFAATPGSHVFGFAVAIGYSASAADNVSFAAGSRAQATAYAAIAIGRKSEANHGAAVTMGADSIAKATASVALGRDAVASRSSAVALGHKSIANENYTVSVGRPGSPRRIVNVATGVQPTDAVNLAQMKALIRRSMTVATPTPSASVPDTGDAQQTKGDVRQELAELSELIGQQEQQIAELERRL
jgi:hypothetical protein